MTDELRLHNLPSEVLLLIFDYCGASDLVRLSEVCRRFSYLVARDTLWVTRRDKPLVTNQASKKFRERCNALLDLRSRWHVSENWQRGRLEEKILYSWEEKAMPWIRLTRETLWWSGGNQLSGFRRKRTGHSCNTLDQDDKIFDRNEINSDISKFVVRDDYIISGHRDGGITLWARTSGHNVRSDLRIDNAHSGNVNAIDELGGMIISGSSDGTVKFWTQSQEEVSSVSRATIDVLDRIWSVAADPVNGKFAVGSSGHNLIPPLKIFDLECQSITVRHPWKRGAGVFDMSWEDPNTLLTCGYDTYVRKWDIRTGTCVASWSDPMDAALYSLSTDYRHTIVTGTQYNCKAVLWDQRMTNYVQLYFLSNIDSMSSPVYSVSFDSSSFFGTTDRQLIELMFTGLDKPEQNYRDILCYRKPTFGSVHVIL